jgi:hypothetical protein
MARIVVVGGPSGPLRPGLTYAIEASAAVVAGLGANARAVTLTANALSPTRDQAGESFGASNASP